MRELISTEKEVIRISSVLPLIFTFTFCMFSVYRQIKVKLTESALCQLEHNADKQLLNYTYAL